MARSTSLADIELPTAHKITYERSGGYKIHFDVPLSPLVIAAIARLLQKRGCLTFELSSSSGDIYNQLTVQPPALEMQGTLAFLSNNFRPVVPYTAVVLFSNDSALVVLHGGWQHIPKDRLVELTNQLASLTGSNKAAYMHASTSINLFPLQSPVTDQEEWCQQLQAFGIAAVPLV